MKKIVHLVGSNIYSGLEKVACNIILSLQDKYEFIYVTRDGMITNTLKDKKIKYYLIEKMSIKELKKMLDDIKPDLIHAHDYRASCLISLTGTNIPIISHLHNNSPWIKTIHPYSFLYLYAAKRFKNILIVSKSIQEEYIFSKYLKDEYIYVTNPLDRSSVLDKVKHKLPKKYDICCVGRLTYPKSPIKFIKIIYELKKNYPNIKSLWVGTGELFNKCQKLVKKYHLENNIEFVGYRENPYIYMQQARIFLLTSRFEGYPLVIFESLTLGVPCVASKVGGIKELLDNKSGFLCQKEKDYIKAIKFLLNNSREYKIYSKNSLLRSKELENKNEYLKKMENLYEKNLSK